jgi:prolyl oligopeptidase
VLPEADGSTAVVGLDGDDIFVSTTTGEDRGRILKKGPGHEPCEIVAAGSDIIASSPYPTARMSTIWRDQLFVTRLRDGHSTLTIHALDGSEIGEIATPGFCSINGLLPTIDGLLVQLESFTIPETLWSIDTSRLMLSRAVPAATPSLAMEWKTEIAISSDGTRVPCTVATPEGQATPHPVLLLAYGGLGAPMTPRFREEIWLALHQGISVALAHVRGGGEFGRAWHRAAMGANKQRTFDDFYAVAGKLIESRITTANRLMVKGESYGGLLAAVAYTQRPELFAAVVAEVPLLDVVRQLALPGGGVVGADLGDPLKNETIFNHVLAFAPMQNLSPHDRKPALLVTSAALDNRALPGQAFKFVAAAQRVARSDQPVLLNLVENCGHSGWALSARREQAARTVAFLASVPHP